MSDDLGHYYIDDRCVSCDCRPWGAWAKEPCGAAQLSGPPMSPEQFEAGWRIYSEAMNIAEGES